MREDHSMTQTESIQTTTASEINPDRLLTELKSAVQMTLFTSTLRVSPRQVNQFAQDTTASFLKFLDQEDEAVVRIYGQQLAQAGFGHQSILALSEALRRICWENPNPGVAVLPAAGRYANALLLGYMAEREAHILREQERTHQAFLRVQAQ
jgi:hypothetical protein